MTVLGPGERRRRERALGRAIEEDALARGGFEVIVSGQRKGVGSSRETAAQAEFYSGIRLAILVT